MLRCYSVVRVYVKVQCGGFVLRLGEERGKRENRLIVTSGFKAGTRDTHPISDGDFFDVAASCRSSLSPNITHWHFFRHHSYTSTTNATMTSTKIVIGWLAAPSKRTWRVARRFLFIRVVHIRAWPNRVVHAFRHLTTLYLCIFDTDLVIVTRQGVYILKISWKYS